MVSGKYVIKNNAGPKGEGMIGREWSACGTILLMGKDVTSAPAKSAKTFFVISLEEAFKKTNSFDQLVDVARFLDRLIVFIPDSPDESGQ
jgi:hypothetical protein